MSRPRGPESTREFNNEQAQRFAEEKHPVDASEAATGFAAPFRPRMGLTIPQLRQAEVTAIDANGAGPEPEGRT